MDFEKEPVLMICFSRGVITSKLVLDPGVLNLEFRINSKLIQFDSEIKTSSGSGSNGSDVGSHGGKSGWPARESRLSSFFDNSEAF